MKRNVLVLAALAAGMLAACSNGAGSSTSTSTSGNAGSTASASSSGETLYGANFFELSETDIGTTKTATADKLAAYSSSSPLKIGLVTDSGTLNDHSFNEAAWKGVNEFATVNGGGTLDATTDTVTTGSIQTKYVQPAADHYDTDGRVAAIKTVVDWGAKIVVLPGYLFESAIKVCIDDSTYNNVYFLALDCNKEDDDNGYAYYDYTNKVTSVIYREEEAGFEAGYGAVKEGYRKLGFCGGMAVPAVVRYGSGYCQGADAAARELGLADNAIGIQYYYAGAFAATTAATQYCTNWYSNGYADVIFGCGGAVYGSVTAASEANGGKPWIGVDVNQHADTTLGASQATCITSAMKNLQSSTEILLSSWVNSSGAWNSTFAGNVVTVGAKSDNCVLPTPDTTGDSGCWGFKNWSISDYQTLLGKLQAGTIKVNSNSDDADLAAHNYSCSSKVKVNVVS